MKGDFSIFRFDPLDNYAGVLYQQGRVMRDADLTEGELIDLHWKNQAGRDAIGPDVAAVPAAEPDGFKVESAAVAGTPAQVHLKVKPGRAWVDGMLLNLPGDAATLGAAVGRVATYFGPPISSPTPTVASIGASVRDAVVLEVDLEELNAFQVPERLIEPAFGGPDTSERIHTRCAFRLLRLGAGEDCDTILAKLKEDPSTQGKLSVSLQETTITVSECPVVAGGGYTGFEHNLYRIEIAATNGSAVRFKWSQFNGALVGRGDFDATVSPKRCVIGPNRAAIINSGLSDFYLEALQYDETLGYWRVAYGANATLNSDHDLELTDPPVLGAFPASTGSVFFRLWNKLENVADFTNAATPAPLNDGIRLVFDTPTASNYRPGDYWTFSVRAGEIKNAPVLIDHLPPAGPRYHRVPLAEIDWGARHDTALDGAIDDCRRLFDPLADLRGCCIDVKPGEDIHHALRKIFDAGGGCLCLMPGDHVLRRPIDLSRRSNICIRGFGPASRVLVAEEIGTAAPFVLTGARDVAFESFAVLQAADSPVWRCGSTVRLRVEGVLAHARLEGGRQPLFALEAPCYAWRLADCVFVGTAGLAGRLLASSSIVGNTWIGSQRGVDLVYAQDLQVERNQFLGIHADLVKGLDGRLGGMAGVGALLSSGPALAHGILTALDAAVAPTYVGVEVNGAFDVDVIDNVFYGATGLRMEWTENCLVERNRFLTRVMATSCGIAHGFRFEENRIGVAGDARGSERPLVCEAGLVLLADVVECRISDNVFANVKQGVVFEPGLGAKMMVVRDFAANLSSLGRVTDGAAEKLLGDAQARAAKAFDRSPLLSSSFFRVGTSERVAIEGNQFHAAETGIEWSGTTQIFDFRVTGNAFIGCQDVAIQIEPDARIHMLADPVDTKVRLIENNRFEILSGAVRATIGAVRVEKNDIRVDAPMFKVMPPKSILEIATRRIYNSPSMAAAVQSDDIPLVSMMAMEATGAVERNPEAADAAGFAKDAGDDILKTFRPGKGDALADKVSVVKTLADLRANSLIATLVNTLLPKWTFNGEGFVINLAGIQNRVVHNRLYGKNPQRPGGVLYNAVSGEVRDNEIVVPGNAVQLNGKAGLASGYQGAEICGNSLASVGVAGSKTAAYALAIPSLSPGNLAINDNLFKGSVMIGGDPLSAQGFSNNKVFVFPGVLKFYHAVKLDMATFAASSLVKAFPAKLGNFGVFQPPGIIFQIWLTDPHANRPIVQFSQNRVIQGWLGIFQALSGAYWSAALLKSQASQALIANVSNNVLDYGASAVGYDLVLTGNHSQAAFKYRVGRTIQAVGNIPAAASF